MRRSGHKNSGSHKGVRAQKKRKKRLHITLDPEVVEEMNALTINKSQFFNQTARWILFNEKPPELIRKLKMVRWPGFEPGPAAWQAAVLGQARLPPHKSGR